MRPNDAERTDQADVRAFRGLDRAHAAVVRRVDVADLHAGAVAGQTAGTERGEAARCVRPARVGLVHELGELEVPKNSFSAATGRMLIRDCGVIASTSWVVIRSRTTRSMRARPVRSWF